MSVQPRKLGVVPTSPATWPSGWMTLALIVATGCGRFGFDALDGALDSGSGDAPAVDAVPPPCATFGPFGAPTAVAALNTGAIETSPSLSDDGLTMVLSSFRDGDQDIYISTRSAIGAPWDVPVKIAELELAGGEEGNPEIGGNGLELFYGESQMFRSTRQRTDLPWEPAQLLFGAQAGMFGSAQGPELSRDGLVLLFSGTTSAGSIDVWYTTRPDRDSPYSGFTRIDALATGAIEGFVTLTYDQLEMFYTSDAMGTKVYRAQRAPGSTLADFVSDGVFLDIDHIAQQEDAELSYDGTELYFISERPGGQGNYDIWVTVRSCL